MWGDQYRVKVPEGRSGEWRVERFVITPREERFERLRAACNPQRPPRWAPAGAYTRLLHMPCCPTEEQALSALPDAFVVCVMSDTPAEIWDHREPIIRARGRCLINGLGLGVVLGAILQKADVEHVTVVEISEDVISLVGPYYLSLHPGRLEIIQADAFTWLPPKGVRYGMVWHDIWSAICGDNLPGMKQLHRKYGHRCDWQGSWARGLCSR